MLESISESAVFEVVKRNIVDILEEVDEGVVTRDKALVDRADIVTGSMEDLGLSFPMRELAKIANIDDLVGFLYSKATEG